MSLQCLGNTLSMFRTIHSMGPLGISIEHASCMVRTEIVYVYDRVSICQASSRAGTPWQMYRHNVVGKAKIEQEKFWTWVWTYTPSSF